MANEEQLSILKQGTKVWNKWKVGTHPLDTKIDLSRANLSGMTLDGIDFSHVDLSLADLSDAHLWNANFSHANLSSAYLGRAYLMSANLSQVSGFGVNLSRAVLRDANFYKAAIMDTDLSGANLQGTVFVETNFHIVNFLEASMGGTIFAFTELKQILHLDTVRHSSRSSIGYETILSSAGKIPEIFLRGCGLSDLDIEYVKLSNPSLDPEQVTDITYKINELYTKGGIQYYSCFISYSSKDQEFAQRLHDDLQNNGVRCWFDREDIRIGDPIRPTIDRQIRLRDKLLVILSENSIKSEYVGDEVEAAFEEESKSNRLVLFPIRLDDAVLNMRDDWAAKIKRRRHIGDFSNWKDEASYQKAFKRLLRDLKATGS